MMESTQKTYKCKYLSLYSSLPSLITHDSLINLLAILWILPCICLQTMQFAGEKY